VSIEDSSVTSGTRNSPNVTIQVTTAGEVNSGLNVGNAAEVFKDKNAAYLRFRTLEGGAGVSIVENDDTITFSVDDISNQIDALSTDDIDEGSRLYYSDTLARAAISASGEIAYNSSTGELTFVGTHYTSADFDTDLATKTTADLTEDPSAKYYTDTRARAAISGTDDVSYDAVTGEISVTTYKTADFTNDFAAATDGKHFLLNWAEDNDGHLIPDSDITFDIGSATNRVRDLWLDDSTLHMGTDTIRVDEGDIIINGDVVATEDFVNDSIASNVDFTGYATETYVDTALSNVDIFLDGGSSGTVFGPTDQVIDAGAS
jgi:hypothetical protein